MHHPADDQDQDRQQQQAENHTATVDHEAAEPLPEIIPFRFENKPFISEEGNRDADDIGEDGRQQKAARLMQHGIEHGHE